MVGTGSDLSLGLRTREPQLGDRIADRFEINV